MATGITLNSRHQNGSPETNRRHCGGYVHIFIQSMIKDYVCVCGCKKGQKSTLLPYVFCVHFTSHLVLVISGYSNTFFSNTYLSLPLGTANINSASSSFKYFHCVVFLMLCNDLHFVSGHLHKIFHLGHTENSEAITRHPTSHCKLFTWEKTGNAEQ